MFDFIKKLRKKARPLFISGRDEPMMEMSQYISLESSVGGPTKQVKDERKKVKPKDVLKEVLENRRIKIDLSNLDEKIKVVKRRMRFMRDEIGLASPDENKAIEFLEARKKIKKYKDLFRWQITTREKIDNLLKKYKLRTGTIGGYHRAIPSEAIDEMEDFCRAYSKVSRFKPTFELIVDDGGEESRKDPIILALSPFGMYYYVLGAWDKEVEIIDKLFLRK